jgi:hypothetical protein
MPPSVYGDRATFMDNALADTEVAGDEDALDLAGAFADF